VVYLISFLRVALTVGVIFGFPAAAVLAYRKGGRRRLVIVTALAFSAVLAFALMAASRTFGNVRPLTQRYVDVALGTSVLFGFNLGAPLVAAAFSAALFGKDKLPFWAVYAATIGAAAVGWIVGTLAAFWALTPFV